MTSNLNFKHLIVKRLLVLSDENLGIHFKKLVENLESEPNYHIDHGDNIKELLELTDEDRGKKIKSTNTQTIDDEYQKTKKDVDFYINAKLSKRQILKLLRQQKKTSKQLKIFYDVYEETIFIIKNVVGQIEIKSQRENYSVEQLIEKIKDLSKLYMLSPVETDEIIRIMLAKKSEDLTLSTLSELSELDESTEFDESSESDSPNTVYDFMKVIKKFDNRGLIFNFPRIKKNFFDHFDSFDIDDTNQSKNFSYSKIVKNNVVVDKDGEQTLNSFSKIIKNENGKTTEKTIKENKDKIIIEETNSDGKKIITTKNKNNRLTG